MSIEERDRDHGWPEGVLVSEIAIRRTITEAAGEAGDVISVHSWDAEGESLTLLEVLGLLEFAKDTFLRTSMEVPEVVDQDDDDEEGSEEP